jgi:ABC-type Na+ efflux pump permease subunit
VARWSFVGAGLIFGVLLLFFFHTGAMATNEFQLALIATIWGEIAVITLVAINMAATAVSREREDGTLDLILTTPITPGAYLRGKLQGLVAYLLPMLAVPVGTLALAGVYVLFGGLERAGGVMRVATVLTSKLNVPVVLPEAAILLPLVIVMGLQWSLKSKGTLGSVVSTVAVVGVASLVIGLCAYKAGESLPVVGPVLNAMSPATLAFSLVYPVEGLFDTVSDSGGDYAAGLVTARWSLALGAIIAGAAYVGVVYAIHMNMVRTFDFTVRKLAGTN